MKLRHVPIYAFSLLFLLVIAAFNQNEIIDIHFLLLAESFVNGKLHFLQTPYNIYDTVLYKGQYFWPHGPFPAIVLVPVVLLSQTLNIPIAQGYVHCVMVMATMYVWYSISKRVGFNTINSLYSTIAFCACTVFFGVAIVPGSWYFAQVIATLLISLSILEYLTKKRYWLIGILIAATLATRLTAGLGILFFVIMILRDEKKRLLSLLALAFPYVISIGILALYNYSRFGNPLETGYALQLLPEPLHTARKYGLYGLVHVPGNLYHFLFAGPLMVQKDGATHVLTPPYIQGNKWGMSIFVTSPYLIFLLFQKLRDRRSVALIATSVFVAIPIFLYYGIGFVQYGYRYSLDFLPWIHLLFLLNWKDKTSFSPLIKGIILGGGALNFYLLITQFIIFSARH